VKRNRCYVPDASGDRVTLPEAEAHHVRQVLRLAAGTEVLVFDGHGGQWRARVRTLDRQQVVVDLLEPFAAAPEPPVRVTLAVGLLKGDQMSTVVRDATALGVDRIVPCVSSHVALPTAARRTIAIERLARIAASSATQCGRAVVPVVGSVQRFEDLIGDPTTGLRIMCAEPAWGATESSLPDRAVRPDVATVFIGPEGGWSNAEVVAARQAGAVFLSLGPRTLRAEIAPTVGLSLLWAHWGW
jgi:16S rRNA (uracil1498-N3)-methyltransferase